MKKILFSLLLILCLFLLFRGQSYAVSSEIDSLEKLQDALSRRTKEINVSNIDLKGATISLNYDVEITGNKGKATLKNGYFVINGPNYVGGMISIKFANLILDGGFVFDLENAKQELAYEEIFGSSRDEYRAITATFGYFNLDLNNIEICNYSSERGSCLYVENEFRDEMKYVSIKNSKFYNNISGINTIHLSNDKMEVEIKNSDFYNNYAYKGAGFSIANGVSNIDNVNIHDNYFLPFDYNASDSQMAGGGASIYGSALSLTNSNFYNNESNYGGGLMISSASSGEKPIVIKNIVVHNNKARHGGAVSLSSLTGQPIVFLNSLFYENEAEEASSIYTEVYAFFSKAKNNGGLVEFLFCSFVSNTALDKNTFDFYKKEATKGTVGTISLKGCFVIGDDLYQMEDEDYNYIATKHYAELQDSIENDYYPAKGSVADIKVKSSVYHEWSTLLSNNIESMSIGYSTKKYLTYAFIYILIGIISCVLLLGVGLVIFLVIFNKRKKHKHIDEKATSIDEYNELFEALNDREKQIVKLTLELKKRKEIADILNYSENTIKKDLTSIYTKLGVNDKTELIVKYRDLIKQDK